jgi:membrane protease YdiL (CAAX protease family)
MNRTVGFNLPLLALVLFGILYLPPLRRFLPADGWVRLLVSPQVFFLGASLIILRVRKLSFREIGLSRDSVLRHLRTGTLLGIAPAALTLLVALLLTAIDTFHPFLTRPLFGGDPLPWRILGFHLVSLLVLAPFCEELFFRGILLKSLREQYPAWIAVAASSLLFMGAHGSLAAGPLILSVVNCVVVLRTGSILPGIVFHAISNAYGPLMTAFFPNLYRTLSFLYP